MTYWLYDVGHSETYAVIKGLKEGATTVTAQAESERGAAITKTCAVTVGSSEEFVHITFNGADVSGENLEFDIAGLSLAEQIVQLSAESSEESDTFSWSTIDDKTDPVIRVYDDGRVSLNRKGTAGKTAIAINTEGQDLSKYKRVQLPAKVDPAPTPSPTPAPSNASVTVNAKTVSASSARRRSTRST